ncbi:hypothetical protein MLOOGBEN_08165 [Bacillus sp. EB106-08-02-XG196]|uniref:hypothetical protein n=1 Tax=Bacillus sp. EB106-08-02-XG196 TaxID=2737049 RepID=UPI0015C48BE5|nr:hypothetical protein [Bacillus sp. EB106-08-02-XG196]NWQ40672.1 hypothetical protein [Bacillus sp. EB106-08-02-XG196]
MKRMPFERPTEHYDEKIFPIDEQICALLKQRKDISNNNPGFPPPEYISEWAKKYGLYEDLLNSVFGTLRMEDEFKPRVEPKNFIKHVPILQSVEKDERLYTLTFLRQYENATVVQLNMDWDDKTEDLDEDPHLRHMRHHRALELRLGENYECRIDSGSGSDGHFRQNFIVFPPLPDDPSGLTFVFKEYHDFSKGKPTGLEIVFRLN